MTSTCPHTPRYPADVPTLAEAWRSVKIANPDNGSPAATLPLTGGGDVTKIAPAFYRSLGNAERAAVIAHERAHALIGLDVDCESCADKVGGYVMRCWGYGAQAAAHAMQSAVGQWRDGYASALEGARAAESRVAARGLAGTPVVGKIGAVSSFKSTAKTSPTTVRTKGPGAAGAVVPGAAAKVAPAPKGSGPSTKKSGGDFFDHDFVKQIAAGIVVAAIVAVVIKG